MESVMHNLRASASDRRLLEYLLHRCQEWDRHNDYTVHCKQEESEGQFARLLKMQQQWQEQLTAEHCKQLQELGQQQQQQTEVFLQEQHRQLHEVEVWQNNTDEVVESLQQDLKSTKSVMKERLQSAEAVMVAIEKSHYK